RFYADRDAWSRGGPVLAEPGSISGYWSAVLPTGGAELSVDVGVGFAVGEDAAAADAARTRAGAAATAEFGADVAARAAEFDAVLAAAPRPEHFALQGVDPLGVTAEQVRTMYFRAWTFLVSSVLPATPEGGNPYPQLATGKAALYLHGPAGAAASASWDSTIGMQLLAHVAPELAWGAYEGLLSRVEEDGRLPGEYLPAREAQTAWTLVNLTGDTERLAGVYPALRRLLTYKQDKPVYGGEANQNYKDLAFVSSALTDTEFASRIATVLGETDDVGYWADRY